MTEWAKQEVGRVDDPLREGFVAPGIPLGPGNAPVVGRVALLERSPLIVWPSSITPTKTTSDLTEENSAGYIRQWDSQTLQELKDFIATIITQPECLVAYFVCNVIATSKKGSQ